MTDERRKALTSIMNIAWSFSRAEPARPFSECLKSAWAWTRRMAASSRKFMARARRSGGFVALSPSLIRSPASNRYGYGTTADRDAGRSISRVGR